MKKLFDKSEIWFAVSWIVVYVVGSSIADNLSAGIGIEKLVTLFWNLLLAVLIAGFIWKNQLADYYELHRSAFRAGKYLYYIPLVCLASVNIWFGIRVKYTPVETVIYICSMLLVGFLEEVIFRGFLFKAMSRDDVRSAIIVSSLTFGIGHIVNLLNGSGAALISNLCQVCYAVAIGFLFVTIVHRGKSLWPCIITHGFFNALSAFSDEAGFDSYEIPVSMVLMVISLAYAWFLTKTIPTDGET